MKKYLFAVALALLFQACLVPVHAQTESAPKKTDALTSHMTSTLNVYSSQWLDAPKGITVRPVSPGYSLYVNYKLPLYQTHVMLMIGAGVAYTDFRTNGYPVTDAARPDSTYFVQLQPADYKRNKMSLLHVEVPLELRFSASSAKHKKGWYVAPGFVAGLLVNDYMKTVSEDDDGRTAKRKIYYTRNLAKYNYGASVRVGFGVVGLYGYYGLSPLFEDGKGPGMTFYKVGLTMGGF